MILEMGTVHWIGVQIQCSIPAWSEPGMWKRLFRQLLPRRPLPLPTEPGLYFIYELADKHDYQNQQLTIHKGTLLVKMIS